MNCTYHYKNQISMICIAPHKCQYFRKLCAECQYEHGVDQKHIVPTKIFQEKVMKQITEYQLGETSELHTQFKNFKYLLSQTESILKNIQEELSKSIQQIYEMLDRENQSIVNLINENSNVAEFPNSDLEKLVQIAQGNTLIDWNNEKMFYWMNLEKIKNWWEEEINTFSKKIQYKMKEALIKISPVYQIKDQLDQVFQQTKYIDEQVLCYLISLFRKKKISNCIEFLSQDFIQFNQQQTSQIENGEDTLAQKFQLYNLKYNIKFLSKILNNIHAHEFNKKNYSTVEYQETRKKLITNISEDKKIIEFLIFLVKLTAIDERFIQCGSNSLNILVKMKANVSEQNLENIKIRDTSLIGANLTRCNLNGSIFENVDISEINLNGAQLFYCKWANIKISELYILDSHSNMTKTTVCFSPDGTTLASGGEDETIILWEMQTGTRKSQFHGHKTFVYSVCFSPDGTTLASGSEDKTIILWEVQTGLRNFTLCGHTYGVNSVCFSPDGTKLASGSGDKTIILWEVQTGFQQFSLHGHTQGVNSVCFSPDGTTLASGSEDKTIILWEVQTGLRNFTLCGHTSRVNSVCFSPDGTKLASGSGDKTIILWEVQTGLQQFSLHGHTQGVNSVCFSPNDTILASGSYDATIILWDVQTRQIKQVNSIGSGSEFISLCFSTDGAKLAFLSDKSIQLWDVETKLKIPQYQQNQSIIYSICFSPDSAYIAFSQGNTIILWDMQTGLRKFTLCGHTYRVNSVCFSPDGTKLASGSGDKTIILWEVQAGLQQFSLHGHTQGVNSVCFSPDGTNLASGSRDQTIILWEVQTGIRKSQFHCHTNEINSLCFSLDGTILASSTEDQNIIVWVVLTGEKKYQQTFSSYSINSLCFTPDCSTVICGCQDSSIRFLDTKTGEQKRSLRYHTQPILLVSISLDGNILASSTFSNLYFLNINNGRFFTCYCDEIKSICFSPDSTTLVSGNLDKLILWDVKTKKQKHKLNRFYNSIVQSACFSPNNQIIACIVDHVIQLWFVENGQQFELHGHTSRVYSVCFTSDSTQLASSSDDNSIILWNIQSGKQTSQINCLNNCVYLVCFSPDGTLLAGASFEESIHLWDIKTEKQAFQTYCPISKFLSICLSPDNTKLAFGSDDNFILLWNIQTGQQISQIVLSIDSEYRVCFSVDSTILAYSNGNKIRLWNACTGESIKSQSYKEYLNQFQFLLLSNSSSDSDGNKYNSENTNLFHLYQCPVFQAQRALMFKGEFKTHLNTDLRNLFKSKGCSILEKS